MSSSKISSLRLWSRAYNIRYLITSKSLQWSLIATSLTLLTKSLIFSCAQWRYLWVNMHHDMSNRSNKFFSYHKDDYFQYEVNNIQFSSAKCWEVNLLFNRSLLSRWYLDYSVRQYCERRIDNAYDLASQLDCSKQKSWTQLSRNYFWKASS